jgi:hypothetical protein
VLWTGLSSVGSIFGAKFGALVKTAVGQITDMAAPEKERHIPLVQPLWEFVQCNKRFRRPVIRHDLGQPTCHDRCRPLHDLGQSDPVFGWLVTKNAPWPSGAAMLDVKINLGCHALRGR